MDVKIYIMTHKQFQVPRVRGYEPMQVGRSGKQDLGYLCDNTGDHISNKNSSFCELTGLYWIWKNTACDVVGLCHYRRYFIKPGTQQNVRELEPIMLPLDYIIQCMGTYDLIVPESGMTWDQSVFEHYSRMHCASDLEECGRVMKEKYPDYYQAFLWNQDLNLISLGNMLIGKKEVVDQYCEWLFDILFELEKRLDLTGRDDYQKRVFGFLSERLIRVWLLRQHLKIREEPTVLID